MKLCPYCGYSNYDTATQCRKCDASLGPQTAATVYKPSRFGPDKGRALRSKALAAIVIGILMKVYWGGVGPWPVIQNPTLASIRSWLEPLLLYGGVVLYAIGLLISWF